MPGVKVVELGALQQCHALTDVECDKLERIGRGAFGCCFSLSSVDLPSIKIVGRGAFTTCTNLINAKFGKDLESIREESSCSFLERITLPLKDNMIADNNDNTFMGCKKLEHVDLVEGAVLHETVAALLLEEWKDDMNEEIDRISQNLASAPAGDLVNYDGKTQAIQAWITSVLRKIIHYKAEHRRILNEAATTLQPSLPNDIVLKNVHPFLELPSYTFEGEN